MSETEDSAASAFAVMAMKDALRAGKTISFPSIGVTLTAANLKEDDVMTEPTPPPASLAEHLLKHARWMVESGQFRGTVREYLGFLRPYPDRDEALRLLTEQEAAPAAAPRPAEEEDHHADLDSSVARAGSSCVGG